MQTRREVIKAGAGLAAIIAAGKAPAAIVRSMIAARNAMLAGGGGWKNPYVTDGLVAMWDGEWNAGGGVHDTNATTFVDLSGNGYDLTVDPLYGSWGDNYIVPISDNGCPAYRENARAELASKGVVPAVVEVVYEYTTGNTMGIVVGLTYLGSKYRGYVSNFYYSAGLAGSLFAVPQQLRNTVISCSASSSSMYCNGGDIGSIAFTNGLTASGRLSDDISLFGTRHIGEARRYPYRGKLYTLRVYGTEITTEQRLANYVVDAARFNLPTAA